MSAKNPFDQNSVEERPTTSKRLLMAIEANVKLATVALAAATVAFGRTAMIFSRRRAKAKLISKTDVSHFFGVSKRTVDRWVLSGKLPKPTRKFGLLQRWDYEKIARLRKSKPGI